MDRRDQDRQCNQSLYRLTRAKRCAPHLSNYAAAAGGRSFPSAAGYHTSKTFFTDDEGVYLLDNRDSPACTDRAADGSLSFDAAIGAVKGRIKKLREGRLGVPPEVPYVEPHNTWVVNQPGTLLVLPVADLAQHLLLNLCYFLQNGAVIRDDVHGCPIPGIEKSKHILDVENTWPLTLVEQWSLTEATTELSTSCYAGVRMLQAQYVSIASANSPAPCPRCWRRSTCRRITSIWSFTAPFYQPGAYLRTHTDHMALG